MSFISIPTFNQYAQASGTWAQRPSSAALKSRYFATDIGLAGSLFSWDGTNWRPANGSVKLASIQSADIATPIATLNGTGATQIFALPSNILIPGGLLIDGGELHVHGVINRSAVAGGGVGVSCGYTLGVNNSAADQSAWLQTATAAVGNAINLAAKTWLNGDRFGRLSFTTWGAATTGNLTAFAVDFSLDQFVNVLVGSQAIAGDVFNLYGISVEYKA